MSLTVVFGDFVENYCAGRHIDSNSKRLGGKHHFYKTLSEAFFNCLLETRYETGMVNAYSRL
jgi:hypothetical protein